MAKPRGSLHLKVSFPISRLFLLSHPARVTRSLQEVVPSFAVAKVYQIPNTNQILTRKSLKSPPQSCMHPPDSKQLTWMEKIFIRLCNSRTRTLGSIPRSIPKSSLRLSFRPGNSSCRFPRHCLKGIIPMSAPHFTKARSPNKTQTHPPRDYKRPPQKG